MYISGFQIDDCVLQSQAVLILLICSANWFFQHYEDHIIYRTKAELLELKPIHLFARELFLMKKLEIEKTKPTFIISVSKVEY